MAPPLEISIPSTTTSSPSSGKAYTVYNITLRLPLRSYTIQKRYSDFSTLHTSLTSLVGTAPPATIPSKSWFTRTVNSPELTEQRRGDLEKYLQIINTCPDNRWRNTAVWRAFLNLPSSYASQIASSTRTDGLHSVISGPAGGAAPINDPSLWLDCHRDLKTQLHDARLNLTNRDQASTPQKQHEASAAAKSCLVKAGSMITAMEDGLSNIQKSSREGSGWGSSQKLGDGEVRRRKDLIASAKKDKEGLENLLNAMTTKSKLDNAVATLQDKQALTNAQSNTTKPRTGRVLGKETEETRELDNQGVVQLQKQKMAEQDLDVEELRRIIVRQRELGVQINEELAVQNDLLKMVDEDTDRVQAKVDIAKKRVGKIK